MQKELLQTQVGLVCLAAVSDSWLTLGLALTEIIKPFITGILSSRPTLIIYK